MTTASQVLDVARSFLGYQEGRGNDTRFGVWYGMNKAAWCAMFASYCSFEAGLPIPATTARGYAYCPSGMTYFKRIGRWSSTPQEGAHIFFTFPGEGVGVNHVGLVERVLDNGVVQTIEGNTEDAVRRRNRRAYIAGYGLPPYSTARPQQREAPQLNADVVSMMERSSGDGYWIVAADGGVFSFGDAPFFGSMGGRPLNAPIVAGAAHPSGQGYALVAADGGVFNFGAAKFFGSMGAKPLNAPMKDIVFHPSGDGYWLVGADGGIFAFGAAKFLGSAHDIPASG